MDLSHRPAIKVSRLGILLKATFEKLSEGLVLVILRNSGTSGTSHKLDCLLQHKVKFLDRIQL